MEPLKQPGNEATNNSPKAPFSTSKRSLVTAVIIILSVTISWVGVVDKKTEDYVDKALLQAAVAFGSARALNAGISVLQSAEFGAGIGVNASIHPFEVLDPVNDMVEDFATAMKYSMASLLTQKLLVEMMSTNIFKWLFVGVATFLLASMFLFKGLYSDFLFKCLLITALVRFLFVGIVFLSGLVDNTFINDKTQDEIAKIDSATRAVNQFEQENSDLSAAEREQVYKQIEELESKREELKGQLDAQREKALSAERLVQQEKNALKELKKDMSLWEKFNPFNTDENYEKAKVALDNAEAKHDEELSEEKLLENDLADIESNLAEEKSKLVKGNGLIDKTIETILTLKDFASFNHIKSVAEDSIKTMLQLIALFVFKTLIMPMAFLFLTLRAFKLLWGIDPRALLNRDGATVKNVS